MRREAVQLAGDCRHTLNLPDQKAFFVSELVVIGSIFKKSGEKVEKSLAVIDEDSLHSGRLVRVCNKNLPGGSGSQFIRTWSNQLTLKTWNPSY